MKLLTYTQKNLLKTFLVVTQSAVLMLSGTVFSQESDEEKTLSPYFFVQSEDTTVDQLPLKSTAAEVNISGIIAEVKVQQTYCNEGSSVLEAIYVFPASTKAAVNHMQMNIGNRILIAKIAKKEEAREEYEQAKEEGKTATLLEQDRPNVFQMNVANILPGDTILVEMHYTELIVPNAGIYEFVYPTVVGPRYISPSQDGEDWFETPYQHEGEEPFYKFDIGVRINAGMTIKEVYCPSHSSLNINFISNKTVLCDLPDSASAEGNKDFILQYRLSGNEIESGILLYEGEDENFFLAMVQPPKEPSDDQIPPREYVLIMDVSGSMSGFPINVSKTLLVDLLRDLNAVDRFNVLFFAGGSQLLSETSLPATIENIDNAIKMIENKQGGGGTELLPALERALSLEGTEDYSRIFLIATDGYVAVEKEAFDLIRNNLSNANFFPFGIGSSVNRYIIEGMAHVGMSEPLIVTDETEAPIKADQFRQYIENPVLTNIDVVYKNFEVYDVEPLTVPDVLAERPVLIFGKWKGEPYGEIQLTGKSGNNLYMADINVNDFKPSESNAAIKYLWARHRIQILDDYGSVQNYGDQDSSLIKEITELGLKYSLLTNYTSFIAVDSVIRNEGGEVETVKQPLPMPDGVSDLAIGDWSTGFLTYDSESSTRYMEGGKTINVFIPDSSSFLEVIFPNPVTDITFLRIYISDIDAELNNQLEIFDLFGKLVTVIDLDISGKGWHNVELSFKQNNVKLSPGIYSIRLRIANHYTNNIRITKL
ncbi:MAG: VWA domain-containing protein [Bacteroidales bacterium]|nr:MAG: VWA domain-containing protein [Bacteroidales bacterium]